MRFVLVFCFISCAFADFWTDRNAFMDAERNMVVGANLTLNEQEILVNEMLMQHKLQELDFSFENPGQFLPYKHFFHAIDDIEKSEVFKFIKKMPKGGSLHSHDTALVSHSFLMNLSYENGLYGCVENERLQLRFFDKPDATCQWETLENMRSKDPLFDKYLKTQISLMVEDPHAEYPDINVVWNRFGATFGTVDGMILHTPIFKRYLHQVLQELYDDNVMFIEMRTTLPAVYELDGTTHNETQVAALIKSIGEEFISSHPEFQSMRIIYAPVRGVDETTMNRYVEVALELKQQFGDFIAGFDLVGQEDKGQPLISFIEQLETLKNANISLVFHAGETNWYGSSTDTNLLDAVLLGTKRIGHGFALVKHPKILEVIKEQNIAVELNPISNQVLKLVEDMRNHPGNYLIANNFPVVICTDDPAFWGSIALSHDWYEAFMGFTSREADLKVLKQLALNSYEYSLMNEDEKLTAISQWEQRWNSFINSMYKEIIGNTSTNSAQSRIY